MRVRPGNSEDLPFLMEMLAQAASWRIARSVEEVWARAENRRYLEGWGRAGDVAVLAEDGDRPLGAAWCRLFTTTSHGYGFVAEGVPELTVAVEPERRGQGIGTTLLQALAVEATAVGFPSLSLSVENDNPAKRLYARLGYREVRNDGSAATMVRPLDARAPALAPRIGPTGGRRW